MVFRESVQAARPSTVRCEGERQARARGSLREQEIRVAMRIARLVIAEHAIMVQRELTSLRATRADFAIPVRTNYKARSNCRVRTISPGG